MNFGITTRRTCIIAGITMAVILLYHFRCPPISQMPSETYFQEIGNNRAIDTSTKQEIILRNDRFEVCCVINPEEVGVYHAYSAANNAEEIVAFLFSNYSMQTSEYTEKIIGFYATKSLSINTEIGEAYINQDGTFFLRMNISRPTQIVTNFLEFCENELGFEIEAMLQENLAAEYSLSPTDFNHQLLWLDSPDSKREIIYPPATLNLIQNNNEIILYGSMLKKFSILNSMPILLSPNRIMDAFDDYYRQNESADEFITFDSLTLVYQARFVRGAAEERILVPVWCLRSSFYPNLVFMIDAISGVVTKL